MSLLYRCLCGAATILLTQVILRPVVAQLPVPPDPSTGSTTRIACTQAGAPILNVENVDGVTVDRTGAWPILNFHVGLDGPPRAIGLNSPTLMCMTGSGVTQGELYRQTGSFGDDDLYTLTCFRKGKIIYRRTVSNLNISWAANRMTVSYHVLGDEQETSTLTFDLTTNGVLRRPLGQELIEATTPPH